MEHSTSAPTSPKQATIANEVTCQNTALRRPLKVRLAIVMVVLVYPLVTVLVYMLGPLTEDWQAWHRTLILTPITVVSIVYVINPFVSRYFGWYISPGEHLSCGNTKM
jgi:antibiotic biosynthesis monooxygenase (ABM) superfamily enzyme